jgi:polyisoprenoid-binding protein YceI
MCALRNLCLFLLALASTPAAADWFLNSNLSELSFISIKKGDVAERHQFRQFAGHVDQAGNVKVVIQLASVDTAIAIRDERMRDLLFQTAIMPTAELTTRVDAAGLMQLPTGAVVVGSLQGQLALHGTARPVTIDLLITKLASGRLLVTSRRPVVVNAGDYALAAGVEKLREIAGLPSISQAVPVSFVLTFEQR